MTTDNSSPNDSLDKMIHEIQNYLYFLASMGCRGFDCSVETMERMQRWGSGVCFDHETIIGLEEMAGTCRRCRLSGSRRKVVFGSGDPKAKLMFIGDYPDAGDEEQGLPFAGETGDLFTRIIQAMGFTRENIYMCNAVKCTLPKGREPLQEEMDACRYLLQRQIRIVQPEIICTLGPISTKALLNTSEPLSALRGSFHQYDRILVMPTYHPALLLKEADRKRDVWEDMKLVMKAYQEKVQRIH
ncbi:MAG: uracil-DNA glycosylase [Desulfobacteraceae bacterium]|nr:MAG: uracil-DNA glycosylase [Desulfobacteraceae bacterium]